MGYVKLKDNFINKRIVYLKDHFEILISKINLVRETK